MEQAEKILNWYDRNKRSLPWRVSRNPYAIWVSEIMLQQTQVETVIPYYHRFLKIFPSVGHLSKADIEEVLRLWSGLGYYSRARNLHQAAKIIIEKWGENFPKTKEEWLTLPGIGEYTAGAIASIAFEERVPIVDGNVIRVLTRLFALKGDPKKGPLKKKLWLLAEALLPKSRIGDFNQALMELGAIVCLPENPKCHECPWQKDCVAFEKEAVEKYPTVRKKIKTKNVALDIFLVRKGNQFLLARRNGKRHLQSMWEFPQMLPQGLVVKQLSQGTSLRHSIMNHKYIVQPVLYRWLKGKPLKNGQYVDYSWIQLENLSEFPTSSLNVKIAEGIKGT